MDDDRWLKEWIAHCAERWLHMKMRKGKLDPVNHLGLPATTEVIAES
jgi:hypothetical protein